MSFLSLSHSPSLSRLLFLYWCCFVWFTDYFWRTGLVRFCFEHIYEQQRQLVTIFYSSDSSFLRSFIAPAYFPFRFSIRLHSSMAPVISDSAPVYRNKKVNYFCTPRFNLQQTIRRQGWSTVRDADIIWNVSTTLEKQNSYLLFISRSMDNNDPCGRSQCYVLRAAKLSKCKIFYSPIFSRSLAFAKHILNTHYPPSIDQIFHQPADSARGGWVSLLRGVNLCH